MAKICRQAEGSLLKYNTYEDIKKSQIATLTTAETVCCAAVLAAFEQGARLIVVLTNSGDTGRLVCKFRPPCPVLCIVGAKSSHTARQLAISRGALAYVYDDTAGKKSATERVEIGIEY